MVKWSIFLLKHYKTSISRPLAAHNIRSCRFHPSCSVYARTALLRFGFVKGWSLAFIRILKCNPFYGHPPIEDPVPAVSKQKSGNKPMPAAGRRGGKNRNRKSSS
ncbi:MAG: membrane protein insertion efficiency factor YidD [Acidobacteria bacterium]|nr:membrane protein insertion efficiency factor YidD [Acidobacteriota bacterium]